ncbi:MAG: hypothetical protein KBT28_01580 [Bacteroidales bacterium]|nr:hypothetical protein [Candidatus Colimorpha merdihippi]
MFHCLMYVESLDSLTLNVHPIKSDNISVTICSTILLTSSGIIPSFPQ